MKISELSPDLRPPSTTSGDSQSSSHLLPLLSGLESSVKDAESLSPCDLSSPPTLVSTLRSLLSRLQSLPSLPDSTKLHLWKLSFRLWNACVDLFNANQRGPHNADLRQIAADLLLLAGNPAGIPSPALKTASFLLKTGQIWHDLAQFDRAANCFERATDLISKIGGEDERKLLLDVNLARSRTAWEMGDRDLAIALLNRSKTLISGSPANHEALAEQFLQFGKIELKKSSPESSASKLLSEAFDLCEKGIALAPVAGDLEGLRGRCLQFLAAERLQAEDYEGVLRCVRVLREKKEDREEHPSVGFLAMKAWVGLGRAMEAERELKGLMERKGIKEAVLVAAAESYLGLVGAKAARVVLMGLVGRCRNGAGAAVRVVKRVMEGGGGENGGIGRAKAVVEMVGDERVMKVFDGEEVAKERSAMHAILWNCGAEYFRSKEYQIAAEMFEKSMLYVSRTEENRSRRSNCFRVLSLCHLALGQLDRAQEFIDQAEKLEPNIKCAFIKFKIHLQKKEEEEAISQIQAMGSCIDFNPEFLTLSAHEAIACQSLPVAVASLSFLLNLYIPGKPMPMPEVAVLRNLITLLVRDSKMEQKILSYMKHARTRMTEQGVEAFFGAGAVGNRELNWFAGTSWNMGLRTGKEKKYKLCAEFFELASEFHSAISDETDETNVLVCKCLIMSVGAVINAEEQSKVPLLEAEIKKGMEMLSRAGKLLPSVSSPESSILFFLRTFSAYQLLNHLENARQQQLQLVKSFASSKAHTAQNLLDLALAIGRGARPNPEAAEIAFRACLSALLASPSPDYRMVATVLRNLACLAALRGADEGDKNDGVHGVYRQAYQIIVGLKDGQYPAEEGKWMAVTAWNKAGHAVRLRQVGAAKRWMKMGIDLARHVPGMERYIGGMEESVNEFERICGGGGAREGGESASTSQIILQ